MGYPSLRDPKYLADSREQGRGFIKTSYRHAGAL